MNKHTLGRRHFLKTLTAIGTASNTHCVGLGPRLVCAADGAVKTSYDPAAKLEMTVSEVEMRRNSAGRMLKARIYQPKGAGPFPAVLDLHGGAWNAKDRTAEEPMDRAIASSGVLVVAIDMTLAKEAPYPACVQDANYGVRWLNRKRLHGMAIRQRSASTEVRAAVRSQNSWACARTIHVTTPFHFRSSACRRHRGLRRDAVARQRSARALRECGEAEARQHDENHTLFFNPWTPSTKSNPQEILDRHEESRSYRS